MRMRSILFGATAAMLLTGCEKADAPAPDDTDAAPVEAAESSASAAPHQYADWAGQWTGVEGMYVTITPSEPGRYSLEMQSDLDTKGTYEGRDGATGIEFERGGETLSLTASDGDATGLKYLAGKKDCLTVKTGEGYCRD